MIFCDIEYLTLAVKLPDSDADMTGVDASYAAVMAELYCT